MRLVGILCVSLLVLGGCTRPGADDHALNDQIAVDGVRELLANSVPSGYALTNISLQSDREQVETVVAFYRSVDAVVAICATTASALPGAECIDPETGTVDRGGRPVLVGVECVSDECPEFSGRDWLARFTSVVPDETSVRAMIDHAG